MYLVTDYILQKQYIFTNLELLIKTTGGSYHYASRQLRNGKKYVVGNYVIEKKEPNVIW